jgi:hypothetical protein
MAITTKQQVDFANDRLRNFADLADAAYAAASALLADWQVDGHGTKIPDDDKELFNDGSPQDGRSTLSGQQAHRLVQCLAGLKAMFDADQGGWTHIQLVKQVSVHPENYLRLIIK